MLQPPAVRVEADRPDLLRAVRPAPADYETDNLAGDLVLVDVGRLAERPLVGRHCRLRGPVGLADLLRLTGLRGRWPLVEELLLGEADRGDDRLAL